MRLSFQKFALFTLFAGAGFNLAHADVAIKSYQRSGGFQGFGAFEGQSDDWIQGVKSRASRSVKYQNALIRMAKSGDTDEIIRVDLDKVWNLNLKKRTYTERAITAPPLPESKEPAEKPAPSKPAKHEKPTHRIKRADFSVKKTGDKKDINGFKTERYLASAVIEVEEIASKEVSSFLLDTNIWTTPWTKTLRQASDEHMKFAKAYLQKMGMPISAEKNKVFDTSSVGMLLGVGGAKTEETLESLRKKIDAIDGYAVATETVWTMKEDPAAVARRDKEKAAAAKDEEPSIDASGGAAGIAGGLIGGFAKKKFKERQEKSDRDRAGAPILSTYHEVKSVSTGPIDAAQFDVPSGFKKIVK